MNLSTFRRRQTAAIANRKEIESLFQAISDSNNCIQQMLPNDKKEDMNNIVSLPTYKDIWICPRIQFSLRLKS